MNEPYDDVTIPREAAQRAAKMLRSLSTAYPLSARGGDELADLLDPRPKTWEQTWEHVEMADFSTDPCTLTITNCKVQMAPGRSFIITARDGGFVGMFGDRK